jgi:hypothetical protein
MCRVLSLQVIKELTSFSFTGTIVADCQNANPSSGFKELPVLARVWYSIHLPEKQECQFLSLV